MNLGPWTRFSLANESPSKYVCILDDDTLPGPKWIQSCIERLEQAEEDEPDYCIAASGCVFTADDAFSFYQVGSQNPSVDEAEVDIGTQGWFFRKDILQVFFGCGRQGDGRTGWGLHFAAALQQVGVLTIVLPYTPGDAQTWGMTQAASQERNNSKRIGGELPSVMQDLYSSYRGLGWTPILCESEDEEDTEAPTIPESPEAVEAKADSGT
jgi:hypothetical protein